MTVNFQDNEIEKMWEDIFIDYRYETIQQQIRNINSFYPEQTSVDVPFRAIDEFDTDMSLFVILHPQRVLRIGRNVLLSILDRMLDVDPDRLHLSITDLPKDCVKEDYTILTTDMGRLLAVSGTVTGMKFKKIMTRALFRCKLCDAEQWVAQDSPQLIYPAQCDCGKVTNPKQQFRLYRNQSVHMDATALSLQELPQMNSPGVQQRTIECLMYGNLNKSIALGEDITVNGYAVYEERENDDSTNSTAVFNGLSYYQKQHSDIKLTDEDIVKIKELGKQPDIMELLVNSFATSIYGYYNIKKAILLQLVGGVPIINHLDHTRKRGDIHILLVGDPGVAKSQLIKAACAVAPKAQFTSGKSTSAAGLTAAAVKDEKLGRWSLESGAMVRANQGLLGLDELDKVGNSDRDSLHEGMEGQTLSIAKAGLVCTFHTQTAVLAAANPKEGRFNSDMSVVSQVNIGSPLLSRFDLIFAIKDIPNSDEDERKADYILSSYTKNLMIEAGQGDIDSEVTIDDIMMKKYIAYAKQFRPIPSNEANAEIKRKYIELRKQSSADRISITARQLEAVIRLSSASAKIHLRDIVVKEDVDLAMELVEYYLGEICMGDEGVDIDNIESCISKRNRDVMDAIRDYFAINGNEKALEEDIIQNLLSYGYNDAEIRHTLDEARKNNILYRPDSRTKMYKLRNSA